MSWNKLVRMLLPLLVVIEACVYGKPVKEQISTCFVRASNGLWNERNITSQTFLPPKCPVILPDASGNPSEAYKVDFFAPDNQVSVFHKVEGQAITPTGFITGSLFSFFIQQADGSWKAQATGTYFAGFAGFSPFFKPVDSLVALVSLNDGQVARGVAELPYQVGTATINAPGGNVGVPATASVTNIVGLPGPYTFEWFLDEVSIGSTGSQSWTTYTVDSYGVHRVDALVRGANGTSIFLGMDPFFNDGDPGDTCIICGNP